MAAPPRDERVIKKNKQAWRGTTWFFLKEVKDPKPAPVGKRYRHKGPPMIVSDEWELLKKMRTSPEWRRGALVNSLTVAGIERSQISSAQRICPELKAIFLGKLAEEQNRNVRDALVAVQKEDKDAFAGKKLDAVVRSLEKFELVGDILLRRKYNPVTNEV